MSTNDPVVIGGRYQLAELLGRGGMAEVRKGTDLRLGRAVAVKRLRTDLASDATFQARFRREAQASASLNHPSIVAVYDTGEELSTDGSNVDQPYIVMEYVAGRTLRDILREGRKILPERAMEITAEVLSALDYSHRAGIIHRDIKPGNVMLTPSGDVKVMDFGIARAVSEASQSMTQTAAVVGTAQYLSPEQARGETVDSRSDVYSAGCLLYELLTGRPPFLGDSPVSVAYQHVREHPHPPSDHDTELPAEIDAIVMKALAKRVEDRYQSAAAMRADIDRYLAGNPIQAPTVLIPPVEPLDQSTMLVDPADEADDAGEEEEAATSHTRAWILGALVLALVIALAAWQLPKLFENEAVQVDVPDVVNTTEDEARTAIRNAGLEVGEVTPRYSDEVEVGMVISQDPEGETTVDELTPVDLVVSAGQEMVTVRGVVGMQRGPARTALEDQDLIPALEEETSDQPAGQVIRTDPQGGESVPIGTTVTIYYSSGPETVPDVVGQQEDIARQELIAAGFTPKVQYRTDETDEPYGVVLEQTPSGDTTASRGSDVHIFVNHYEPEEEEPEEEAEPVNPDDQGDEQPGGGR